jgi:hypothetical protein
MPYIDPEQEAGLILLNKLQMSHGNNIIQPVIVLITRLENHSQMQIAILLRRSRRLQEDVGTVVGYEIVSGVCAEDLARISEGFYAMLVDRRYSGLGISETPICAQVTYTAVDSRSGDVAAYDWDGGT